MQTKTLTLDGVQYDINDFSSAVQQLVAIHNKFTLDLQEAQLEMMKTQAAIQQISAQLTEQMKAELAEKDKPAE